MSEIPASKLLTLKIVLYNDTKTLPTSPVHSVHIQTQSNPEGCTVVILIMMTVEITPRKTGDIIILIFQLCLEKSLWEKGATENAKTNPL